MPLHDWTRVDAGMFHDFHNEWAAAIKHALNRGVLPPDYYASLDQTTVIDRAGRRAPDVLTLRRPAPAGAGVVAVAATRPAAQIVANAKLMPPPRRRKNVVAVRHVSGNRVVAMVKILSPGNKASRRDYGELLAKVTELLRRGVHLLLIDPFPPTPRDPFGLHAAIWEEVQGAEEDRPPPGRPLCAASYEAVKGGVNAYVNALAVGDAVPDMPVFLQPGSHVPVPLEKAYAAAWEEYPAPWRELVAE